jgi:hypothetical protein
MTFNHHTYPPTGSTGPGPDAELELLTHIGNAATGPESQAQILALVNGLLDVRLSKHTEALEQAHYHELNARDEEWERRAKEACERELVLQAELATLRGQLDLAARYAICYGLHELLTLSSFSSTSNQDTIMDSSVGELQAGRANPGVNTAKSQVRRRPPSQAVPETAPQWNLRSKSQKAAQSSLLNSPAHPLPTASQPMKPANLQLMVMPSSRVPTIHPTRSSIQTAPTRADPPPVTPLMVMKKGVKKAATQLYRLTKSEIPDDIGGLQVSQFHMVGIWLLILSLQVAIALHLRISWGLIDAKQIPGDPPIEILNMFRKRFSTEAELYEAQDGDVLIPPSLVKIGSAVTMKSRGTVPRQILMVEEHILEYIQACLAKFGLIRWCPDLQQSPYSLYNCACRIIALDTFKQALVSHAYMHLKPNTAYASDMVLLTKLYNHFVHHFMLSRYKTDLRNPGRVKAADKMSPQYRSRLRVSNYFTHFHQFAHILLLVMFSTA